MTWFLLDALGQFMPAYLMVWLFVWGVTLGSLALVMIHHLTGGVWGLAVRRILEAQMCTMPLVALLFIPIALRAPSIFPWAAVGEAPSPHHSFQFEYLRSPFVWWRALGYFATWIVLAWLLSFWSRGHARPADSAIAEWKCQAVSGPGLVIYGLTLHFASIDWMMSVDPSFTSTIYGPIVAAGQLLSAFCLALVVLAWNSKRTETAAVLYGKILIDLGSLLFTLVIVWAYLVFFQAMLIWIADLRHDNVWWLARDRHGWQWLGLAIFVLGFVIPFSLLLFRAVKKNVNLLGAISATVLLAQLAFVAYQVFPSLPAATPYALSLLAVLAMCALWFVAFRMLLAGAPIIPLCDRNWDHARHLKKLEQEELAREEEVESFEATRETMLPRRAADIAALDDARLKSVELRRDEGSVEHPAVRHEKSDIRFLLVAAAVLLLGLALAIVGGSANWLLRRETLDRAKRVSLVNRRAPAAEFPRQPRLEAFEPQLPADDAFATADQARNSRLHSFGPVEESGFVHIPIEKAIEHLAKELQSQGPVSQSSAKEQAPVGGGNGNSNRVLTGK